MSIAGHPLVLLPLAALGAMARNGLTARQIAPSAALFAVTAAVLLGYSYAKVRRGSWRHIDASEPRERRAFNLAALLVIGAGAAAATALGHPPLALGLVAAAAIVAVAALSARWLKLSLHVAFSAMASVVAAWIAPWAAIAALLLVAGLAWSRLVLGRHTAAEVVSGALVGWGVGLLLTLLLRSLSAS